ncbi:Fc receptor-like protein 3, partial [Galemys pyrenaicus]
TAPKALLLPSPPWSTAFKGETVTLTCRGPHSPVQGVTSWYHDNALLEDKSKVIKIRKSGSYICKTQESSFSDPVNVQFSSGEEKGSRWNEALSNRSEGWKQALEGRNCRVILQAPHIAFEGEYIELRCRAKADDSNEKIYYKDGVKIGTSLDTVFVLHSVSSSTSKYHCGVRRGGFFSSEEKSEPLSITVQGNGYTSVGIRLKGKQYKGIEGGCFCLGALSLLALGTVCFFSLELFPPPVLIASPSPPIEGSPVALKCKTQLSPQRSHIQLQFRFFRGHQALVSGWSSSPELQIPTVWREDSGLYWCQAQTATLRGQKSSSKSHIQVQSSELGWGEQNSGISCYLKQWADREPSSFHGTFSLQGVPVSDVKLMVRPPEGQLIEGETLVLICSVAKGTGTITFSWHREGTSSLGRKTERSLSAELRIPSVTEHHAGRYYCSADNILGPVLSNRIMVTPKIPVSRLVLKLRTPRVQAAVGDMVELHCEAQRGSPPILYRFYYEDITLGNSSAPSGGGASFNLSLTTEHSGNYSCEADNGLGAQHSDRITVNVLVPVSHPVLTLRAPAQAAVGDVVELHCEAQRGSPPILYQFYHEDVTLGNSSAPSGGGVSFNLSLTAEHSGNYSCEADNGLGAQRSAMVAFNFP